MYDGLENLERDLKTDRKLVCDKGGILNKLGKDGLFNSFSVELIEWLAVLFFIRLKFLVDRNFRYNKWNYKINRINYRIFFKKIILK